MHITCILILNVFIAISTIKMNARGNREWLTSHKLCCNLFKKFKFKMRQSKCFWLIRGEDRGMCLSVVSQWVHTEPLPLSSGLPGWLFLLCCLSFLIKALGLDLKDLWCSSSSPSLWYSLPLLLAQSVVFVLHGLCGAGGRSIRGVPPSQAGPCVQKNPRGYMNLEPQTYMNLGSLLAICGCDLM